MVRRLRERKGAILRAERRASHARQAAALRRARGTCLAFDSDIDGDEATILEYYAAELMPDDFDAAPLLRAA